MNKRSVSLVSSLTVTVLSLLTAFRVLPGPEIAGVSLAFLSLFIIPGLHIVYLFFGRIPVTAEGFARVFLAGIVFATITLLAGTIPGAGYISVSLSAATISGGMAFLSFVRSGRRSPLEPEDLVGRFRNEDDLSRREKKALLLLAGVMFILCFLLFYGRGETGVETDAPDHISYVARSMQSGNLFPSDSFFREGDGRGFDPRKGSWHPVLALWAYQSDTSADFLWQVLPAFLAFFYLVAFWVFARELVQSIPVALLASLFLVIMYRGGGLEWLAKSGYSKNMMQMMFWMSGAYLMKFLNGGRNWALTAAVILAVFGSAVHIVFAYLLGSLVLSIALFTLVRGWGIEWRTRFLASVPVLFLSVAVPVILRTIASGRTFNDIHTHQQGLLLFGERLAMVDPVEVLNHCGMGIFAAILLVPLVLFSTRYDKRARLCGLIFIVPAALVLNPLTGSVLQSSSGYLYYRMLDAAPISAVLALALAWAIRAMPVFRAVDRRRTGVMRYLLLELSPAIIVLLILAGTVRLYIPSLISDIGSLSSGSVEDIGRRHEPVRILLEDIDEGSVICSDPVLSYQISAFTDYFVTSVPGQHGNPSDLEAIYRLARTRDLFSPYVPFRNSLEWIRKTGISHIVVDTRGGRQEGFFDVVPYGVRILSLEKFRSAYPLLIEKNNTDGLVLFQIDPERSEKDLSSLAQESISSIPGCLGDGTGYSDGAPASGNNAAIGFESTGIILGSFVMDSTSIVKGDTIRGSFCWISEKRTGFEMPLEWSVRLETRYPKGAFYRQWYDKQYRRMIERKNGIFFRKTVSGRVMGGSAHPDLWQPGLPVRQDFIIPVPREMAEGDYEVRVCVRRSTYLPNRTVADYLRNEDSLYGIAVSRVAILGRR